jgi:hypothetical protein
MADDGPPQRPPFNDPHDPRWYSDPASRTPGAGTPGSGSSAVGSSGQGPAGSGAPPSPHGSRTPGDRAYGNQDSATQGYGSSGYGAQSYGGRSPGIPGEVLQPYSGHYGGFAPAEPRGLSIAALALGAAAVFTGGLLLVPQILAVVFGHIALRREPAGKPLALTGLILGYVMLAAAVVVIVAFVTLIAVGTGMSVRSGP